jgi:septum formation protein
MRRQGTSGAARVIIPAMSDPPARPLVLASASPRRRELLVRLGLPFAVVPSDAPEEIASGASLLDAVAALAARKAATVAGRREVGLVVGADTVVVLDGLPLGKPADAGDAARMLRLLRGRTHDVVTGVAVVDAATGRTARSAVSSVVQMRSFSDAEIAAYVATGEPFDKAGGYAIQGAGGALVAAVDGCYLNVVGLPLCELAALLARFGIAPVAIEPVCTLPSGAPCPRLDSVSRRSDDVQ